VHGVGGTRPFSQEYLPQQKSTQRVRELLRGNPSQLITQIVAVAIAYIVAAVGTFILLKILDATVLRLKPEAEVQGMDIHEHGEEGYGRDFTGGISLSQE